MQAAWGTNSNSNISIKILIIISISYCFVAIQMRVSLLFTHTNHIHYNFPLNPKISSTIKIKTSLILLEGILIYIYFYVLVYQTLYFLTQCKIVKSKRGESRRSVIERLLMGLMFDSTWWTHRTIYCSSQCSTTGLTNT